MSDYYIFQNLADAEACLAALNNPALFPIPGTVAGLPAPPENTKTERWAEAPLTMASGEFAVPRPPKKRLDLLNVSLADQQTFLASFGSDIRDLTPYHFPANDEDEIDHENE